MLRVLAFTSVRNIFKRAEERFIKANELKTCRIYLHRNHNKDKNV